MSGKFPFSSSIKVGDFIYVSGTIGMDPVKKELVVGDVAAQTLQTLENIEIELKRYGASLKDAVKATVFLTDMRNFGAMNEAYRSRFSDPLPTRSCVSVSAVPHIDALVEIEMIVYSKE